MKNIIVILLVFIFLYSCKSDNISQIKLNVKSIKIIRESSNGILGYKLKIKLTSQNSVIRIINNEGSISSYIFCPLTSNNFSPENISNESYKLYGVFPQETEERYNIQDSSYNYSLSLSFVDKNYNVLNQDIVDSIIKNKDCIECKLVLAFFPKQIKKNSFSDSFYIQTDKIKKECQ